ncbi:MAG: DoxX family protein [Anaerolineae bacterium]
MKIAKTILQVMLIGQFSFFGISKIIGTAEMVSTFSAFGFPPTVRVLVGLVEVAAVLLLAYGFINRKSVYNGAVLLLILTIGATFCHIFLEGNLGNAIPPVIVFLQTALVVWLHSRTTEAKFELSFA